MEITTNKKSIKSVPELVEGKEGHKKTKIGWIPEEWEITNFSDVYNFLRTFPFSRDKLINEPTKDRIKYIHYGDIHTQFSKTSLDGSNGNIPFLIDGIIDIKEFENEKFPNLIDGDLIIADASEDYNGICDCAEVKNIKSEKIISGLHTFAARPIDNAIVKGFGNYILKNNIVKKEIQRIATGISVYGVSKSNLSKVQIPLPPLPEQQKIAKILSTWDKGIMSCELLVKSLKQRKKGLMQQLLTGKTRLKGFSGEWKTVKGAELFSNHSNKNHDGTLEVLSATQDKGVIPRSETGIDIKYDKSSLISYKKVEVGDYVISLRSFQGGIEYSNYEGLVSPAYTVLKEKMPISKAFYKEFMKTRDFINRLNSIIYGIRDGKQISYKEFGTLKLLYPPVEEQQAIAKVLNTADNEIAAQENYLAQLQALKKGLMQQLLTGQKRVRT